MCAKALLLRVTNANKTPVAGRAGGVCRAGAEGGGERTAGPCRRQGGLRGLFSFSGFTEEWCDLPMFC